MGFRTTFKGLKQSYTENLAPALKEFKDDVSEKAREAKIEYLTTKLEEAKNPPVKEEVTPEATEATA